jgi:hypothetical protein
LNEAMLPASPVADHVASLLVQSTLNSSEDDLHSPSISDEDETQFVGQDEKKDDIEKAEVLPMVEPKKQEGRTLIFVWVVVNTLATIGIVSRCDQLLSCSDDCRSSRTRQFSRIRSFG